MVNGVKEIAILKLSALYTIKTNDIKVPNKFSVVDPTPSFKSPLSQIYTFPL